jgi:acetyl esterase/lipase
LRTPRFPALSDDPTVTLDPRARALLDRLAGRPPADRLPLAEARPAYVRLLASGGAAPAVAASRDLAIPGPVGPIPARLVHALERGPAPLVVLLHGGGWTFGDLDTHDRMARSLAVASGAAVLSVGYRLAPEHPFPAALEDALAAIRWAAGHPADLGVRPGALVVAGDSAGGNLAAAAALAARDSGGPALAFQLLIYPALDASGSVASYASEGRGYRLTRELMAWYWGNYLGAAGHRGDPLACPALAADLSGLPPALVVTAEHDPLRDEGEAYAARLLDAGVPAAAMRYGGQVHGFFAADAHSLASPAAVGAAGEALRRAFAGEL